MAHKWVLLTTWCAAHRRPYGLEHILSITCLLTAMILQVISSFLPETNLSPLKIALLEGYFSFLGGLSIFQLRLLLVSGRVPRSLKKKNLFVVVKRMNS